MQITDTIADILTRIRNASSARHATVDVPASNVKKAITQILLDEGYIKGFQVIEDGKQGVIRITLKYTDNRSPVITGLRRVSKPGLRIYSSCEDMPKVRKGLGIAIVSTSKGIMTDKKARELNVGGGTGTKFTHCKVFHELFLLMLQVPHRLQGLPVTFLPVRSRHSLLLQT